LLLERGVRTYAFAHLSFVEYFAAFYLLQNLTDWLLEEEVSPTVENRAKWTADVRWHEVLIFAFEELQQQNPRLGKRLWNWLFPDLDPTRPESGLALIQQTDLKADGARDLLSNRMLLLSRLTEDRATGCGTYRETIVDWCCAWGWKENPKQSWEPSFFSDWLKSAVASESRETTLQLIAATIPKQITHLNLRYAPLCDLSPLQDLVQLQKLSLNGVGAIDLAPLRRLTKLQELSLDGTEISDLSPLRRLTELETLFLGESAATDLTPLQGLTKLKVLAQGRTGVTDLTHLQGLTKLHWLYLNGNPVTDLSPLRGLTQLEWLYLDGTGVADLTPLQGLTQLRKLYVNVTGVTDLTPIQDLIDRGLTVEGP